MSTAVKKSFFMNISRLSGEFQAKIFFTPLNLTTVEFYKLFLHFAWVARILQVSVFSVYCITEISQSLSFPVFSPPFRGRVQGRAVSLSRPFIPLRDRSAEERRRAGWERRDPLKICRRRKTMKKKPTILVTGFEPFLGRDKNASQEAVKLLPDEVGGCTIVKRYLPVKWFDCVHELDRALNEVRPSGLLATGEGHPVPPLLIERMGHNIACGPDDVFEMDMYEHPIFSNGPAAYFSTFPYAAMHDRLQKENIPVKYSFSAGQNQCNCVTYAALHLAAVKCPGLTAGFIHVPMIADGSQENMMTSEETARALLFCLEEYAKEVNRPVRSLDEYRKSL